MLQKIIKLNFTTPVHFGKRRLSDSEYSIAADTLFSALYIEGLKMKLDMSSFKEDIQISDTFPFKDEILYLPKPMLAIDNKQTVATNYKVYKKLNYIPVDQFKSYLAGKLDENEVIKMTEKFSLGQHSLETKVKLSPQPGILSDESEPYSVGTFRFEKGAGLYFIFRGDQKTFTTLKQILDALIYSGIGGKRFAGYGRFTYEISEAENFFALLKPNVQANCYMLLSTSMAKNNELEMAMKDSNYILKKRTGYIQSTQFSKMLVKKKPFYSFSSGSVFKNKFVGEVVDVGENGNHPVYRYARAFWLGVGV